jgi:hypothetical protein
MWFTLDCERCLLCCRRTHRTATCIQRRRMLCFYGLLGPSKKECIEADAFSRKTTGGLYCFGVPFILTQPQHAVHLRWLSPPSLLPTFLLALSYHCPSIPGGSQTSTLMPLRPGSKRSSTIHFLEDPKPIVLIRIDTCRAWLNHHRSLFSSSLSESPSEQCLPESSTPMLVSHTKQSPFPSFGKHFRVERLPQNAH